jgi:putative CRISPR-associated protein (TIGR02619 family)
MANASARATGGLVLVTSVGASVLTNALRVSGAPSIELGGLFQVRQERELKAEQLAALTGLERFASKWLESLAGDRNQVRRSCAELNVIDRLGDELDLSAADGMRHILVATDTVVGRTAAGVLRRFLEAHYCGQSWPSVEVLTTQGLRAEGQGDLTMALAELARDLMGYIDGAESVVLNLAGGFKGVAGFLQQVGALFGAQILYLHEDSTHLLRIPALPLAFSLSDEEFAALRSQLVRSGGDLEFAGLVLAAEELQSASLRRVAPLFDVLDGQAQPSELGKVLLERERRTRYRRELLVPPVGEVRFDGAFEEDVKRLARDAQSLEAINHAVDVVAAWLVAQRKPLKSETIRSVSEGYGPSQATHEVYVTSTSPAHRAFFLLDGTRVQMLRVMEHPKG